jgi:amino acid transporter
MIKSTLLNIAVLILGLFLLTLAYSYGRDAADVSYYGYVAALHAFLGLWCVFGTIVNFRKRRQHRDARIRAPERVAIVIASGILCSLTLFILLTTLELRFSYNISMDLLAALAGLTCLLALAALPVAVWVRASRSQVHSENQTSP